LKKELNHLKKIWKKKKVILKNWKTISKMLLASVILICENCENLEKKVHYLVETVDKLSKGKSNFENFLASQSCVFGKAGLDFNPQNKQDKFSKSFSRKSEK